MTRAKIENSTIQPLIDQALQVLAQVPAGKMITEVSLAMTASGGLLQGTNLRAGNGSCTVGSGAGLLMQAVLGGEDITQIVRVRAGQVVPSHHKDMVMLSYYFPHTQVINPDGVVPVADYLTFHDPVVRHAPEHQDDWVQATQDFFQQKPDFDQHDVLYQHLILESVRLQGKFRDHAHHHIATRILLKDGSVYDGVRVGPGRDYSMCAERGALSVIARDGKLDQIQTIFVVDSLGRSRRPCGMCAEVMTDIVKETGSDFDVLSYENGSPTAEVIPVSTLLPHKDFKSRFQ